MRQSLSESIVSPHPTSQEVELINKVQDLLQETLDRTVEQIRYDPITHMLVLNGCTWFPITPVMYRD